MAESTTSRRERRGGDEKQTALEKQNDEKKDA